MIAASSFTGKELRRHWHGRHMFPTASRLVVFGFSVTGAIVLGPATALAQPEPVEPPKTRAEVLDAERREKVAELWPERESPLVARVNRLVERGFKEGLDSGEGADGPQGKDIRHHRYETGVSRKAPRTCAARVGANESQR